MCLFIIFFFFFTVPPTTAIYTLSLHDALPISILKKREAYRRAFAGFDAARVARFSASRVRKLLGNASIVRNRAKIEDRKSTRLNSSHGYISYAVFCLKKKIIRKVNKEAHNTHK